MRLRRHPRLRSASGEFLLLLLFLFFFNFVGFITCKLLIVDSRVS